MNRSCRLLVFLLLFAIGPRHQEIFAQTPSYTSYSRSQTDPVEEFSFDAIEAKVAAIRAEGHPIPTGHPRIFITPSSKAALREKIQTHFLSEMNDLVSKADAAYGIELSGPGGKSDQPAQPIILIEALIYQLGEMNGVTLSHSPEEYGRDAVRHLTSDAMLNNHYVRTLYLGVPIGYDWLYDLMSPSQRQTVADRMLLTAFPERLQIKDWNNPPGQRLLGAIALKGDPHVDQSQVDLALDDFYTGMIFGDPADSDMPKHTGDINLTLNHIFNGEGPGSEGLNYSGSYRPIFPFLLAWKDQTGEDYFKMPYFQKWPFHYTHLTGNEYQHQDKYQMLKDNAWNRGTRNYSAVFLYLEMGLLGSNPEMASLMKYHRRSIGLQDIDKVLYLLLGDPSLEMKSPSQLGLSRTKHFKVVNSVMSRNSWEGTETTWAWFQSPTWSKVRDLGPLNDILIWKHGGLLLNKHVQKHDYDGGNRTNTLLFYDELNPGVTYTPMNVMDRSSSRYMNFRQSKGDSIKQLSKNDVAYNEGMRYFEEEEGQYLYTYGDGGTKYQEIDSEKGNVITIPALTIEGWSRQFIWFRNNDNNDPDYFIVVDRVRKDKATHKEHLRFNFGMNPEIRSRNNNQDLGTGSKQFEGNWKYSNANRIVSTNTVTTNWGTAHGRLFIDTLLPHDINYYRMGGIGERNIDIFGNLRTRKLGVSGNPNDDSNMIQGLWRIQMEPAVNNLENIYLNVMQATDSSIENPDSTILIENSTMIGAAVSQNIALFNPTEAELVSGSVVLPPGINGTYRLLFADLTPEKAYILQVGGNQHNKVSSIAGTVFLENVNLQRGNSILVSPDPGAPVGQVLLP